MPKNHNASTLKHYECIVNSLPEAMSVINQEHRYEAVNDSWCAMLGQRREDVIGRHVSDVWGLERYTDFIAPQLERVFAEDSPLTHAALFEIPKIGVRKCAVTYYPYAHPDDELTYTVVVTRDITELEQARDAAEAARVAKSAFLANMSHEMRTPLHQASGMAQLIKREPLTPKQADRMDKLETACRNLAEIIETILDLTKIEAGQFEIAEESISLDELLNNAVSVVREQAAAKHLQLAAEAAPDSVSLVGDKRRIQQALLSYVTNAIRFTEAGSVTLRAKLVEDDGQNVLIRFEVMDTGIGIDPEDQSRLFSIFEQVDNSSTRKYGGLGAGLAITKKIAHIMGGDAGCDSIPGDGSIFWFSVRLKKSERHLPAQGSTAAIKL
jgi:PAS domain S-box-containing protein